MGPPLAAKALFARWVLGARGRAERTQRWQLAREALPRCSVRDAASWAPDGPALLLDARPGRRVVVLEGDWELTGMRYLTRLPPGLCIDGSLFLEECYDLLELPARLSVAGDVVLSDCVSLRRIRDVRVSGNIGCYGNQAIGLRALTAIDPKARLFALRLTSSGRLKTHPAHIEDSVWVLGSSAAALFTGPLRTKRLIVKECNHLVALSDAVDCRELIVKDCRLLESIADACEVRTNLLIKNCPQLVRLPASCEELHELVIENCFALEELPEEITVSALLLDGCPGLTRLPAGLRVVYDDVKQMQHGAQILKYGLEVGDVTLRDCEVLEALTSGLRARQLVVENCFSLTEMPEHVTLERLVMRSLASLVSLAHDLVVHVDMELTDCMALAELPDEIHVEKILKLRGCSSITELPASISFRVADLRGCTSLRRLPAGIHCDRLDLSHCRRLTSLPADLVVRQLLSLEHCERLTSIPSSILEWAPADNGLPVWVRLGGSGITFEALEELREANLPNVRFMVDLYTAFSIALPDGRSFQTLREAVRFWLTSAQRDVDELDSLAERLQIPAWSMRNVLMFLSKLGQAKEMALDESKRLLAERVVDVLNLLADPATDDSMRAEVLQRIEDSIDACHDKPVWALNQMELAARVAKARGDRAALRQLGLSVMRLSVVHEHVERKIATLNWVDDVCVYLKFEIELRDALDLPVTATAMHFPDYIHIKDAEIEAAREDALGISDARFEEWLGSWSEWLRQDRLEAAAALRWEDLDESPRRVSQRLDLTGEPIGDPVILRGTVSSLADLLRHWVPTGLDLNNTPRGVDDLLHGLQRLAPPPLPPPASAPAPGR